MPLEQAKFTVAHSSSRCDSMGLRRKLVRFRVRQNGGWGPRGKERGIRAIIINHQDQVKHLEDEGR